MLPTRGVSGTQSGPDSRPAATRPATSAATQPTPTKALLLAQAQFVEQPDPAGGRAKTRPGPAKLLLAWPEDGAWKTEVIEDSDSSVFHKALAFDLPGERPGILTIGAANAPRPGLLKVWRRAAEGWRAETLWAAQVGEEWNRLRDIEIADVTGDGQRELVIATHDRGVVAVLRKAGTQWEVQEIDRSPEPRIVHEIEIGDVDGDGRAEIFANPSTRNRADGGPQPGWLVMYRWNGERFTRTEVEAFGPRHAREILVGQTDPNRPAVLFAALETIETRAGPLGGAAQKLELRRRWFGAEPGSELMASLPDSKCRFLNLGDVDGDGGVDLVASCYRSGLWVLRPGPGGWTSTPIDADSTGYQHSTTLADLDGDGRLEIYVATDDAGKLRRYTWNGSAFDRADLLDLHKRDITWCLTVCEQPACLMLQP